MILAEDVVPAEGAFSPVGLSKCDEVVIVGRVGKRYSSMFGSMKSMVFESMNRAAEWYFRLVPPMSSR